MILDPLSALGVAGNIVQFVQFSGELVSRAVELYRSSTGLLQQHKELLASAELLKQDSQALLDDFAGVFGESKDERSLRNLVKLYHELAAKLVAVLEDLKPKSEHRKWEAVRQTLRTAYRDSAINSLIERMRLLRDALNNHLLISLNSKSLSLLNNLIKQQKNLNFISQPLDLHPLEAIVTSVKYLQEIINSCDEEEDLKPSRKKARRHFNDFSVTMPDGEPGEGPDNEARESDGEEPEHIHEEEPLVMPQNMGKWSYTLLASAKRARIIRAQYRVLISLRFGDMRTRESNIHDAYENTYNWVVETDRGEQEETPNEIPVARKMKVVICSFFFWQSGSKLQKSQEGLLRTLFYQIFHAYPELIHKLLPERCRGASIVDDTSTDWPRTDLLQLLRRFVALDFPKTAFCLFIDGLDECGEDLFDLIAILLNVRNHSIKMCLASRPWNCFEEVFGQDRRRTIRLEEHNRKDILHFMSHTISGCPGYPKLQRSDPECDSLITEIVDKAQGVFVWVFLVTRSLMRGLTNGDSINTLRMRLKTFPPELGP
ncbi:MAG: hypothetical protein Q9157_002158 [Trypethelium eluteriae]